MYVRSFLGVNFLEITTPAEGKRIFSTLNNVESFLQNIYHSQRYSIEIIKYAKRKSIS